jgi:hypothetical protein
MKNVIGMLILTLGLTTQALAASPALIKIEGTSAQSLLKAMSKKPFSGKDATSGGLYSISDAKLECTYRNKNNELHTGTVADYSCAVVDNDNVEVYVKLTHAFSKYMFNRMEAAKFQGGDSTSGGVDSFEDVSAECQERTKNHELHTGTPADFSCAFTDDSKL